MTCEYFWDEKEKLNKILKLNVKLKFCFQWSAMLFFVVLGNKGYPAISRL